MKSPFVVYGLRGALYLGGAFPLIFAALILAQQLLGHDQDGATPITIVLAVGALLLAGGLWGRSLARHAGCPRPRLLMAATAITFGAANLAAVMGLGVLENVFVEQGRADRVPIYVVFAILFSLANVVAVGLLALVAGTVMRGWRFGARLALAAGPAAGAAFLLADGLQDLLGRRVGGPRAEATFTMLSVALIGDLVAAFVGSGVMGLLLAAARPANSARTEPPLVQELHTP
jgi:hypothetical protein